MAESGEEEGGKVITIARRCRSQHRICTTMKNFEVSSRFAVVGPQGGPYPKLKKWPRDGMHSGFEAQILDKELKAIVHRQNKNGRNSDDPIVRAMYDPNPKSSDSFDYSTMVYKPMKSSHSSSSKMCSSKYPNFVDDLGGKVLLSKGILPSAPIMRHDIRLLTDNWQDVEAKHRELKRQLDAVERELVEKETNVRTDGALSRRSVANKQHSVGSFHGNTTVKPGSHICTSGFQWSGTYVSRNKIDYCTPKQVFTDPLSGHKNNIHTEYGQFTKECDLPEPNTHVNKDAPYHSRCKFTKEELKQRIDYFKKEDD